MGEFFKVFGIDGLVFLVGFGVDIVFFVDVGGVVIYVYYKNLDFDSYKIN